MSTQRKSIRLFPDERQALVDVYLEKGYAIEAYEIMPDELEALTQEWQKRCGRKDAPGDVLHYMRTQRKRGLGVRLDCAAKKAPKAPTLTAEQTEVLVDIYAKNVAELDAGSDTLGYDPLLADFIAREFSDQTGMVLPAHFLVAKLTALRKRGLLPKVSRPEGFDDMDQVVKTS